MALIRAVVVDDEYVARNGLLRLLREDPELEVVGQAATGEEALDVVERMRPDLVFLDVKMPGLDGIAVADAIRRLQMSVALVFVTAYDDHAVRAYELDAIDYLLKPFDRARLRETLVRSKRRLKRATAADVERVSRSLAEFFEDRGPRGADARGRRFLVRDAGTVTFLQLDEIHWLESAGNYLRVYTEGRAYLERGTLTEAEERLGDGFLRINRSAIVNLEKVRAVKLRSNGTYEVSLAGGEKLSASRRRGNLIRAAVARYR